MERSIYVPVRTIAQGVSSVEKLIFPSYLRKDSLKIIFLKDVLVRKLFYILGFKFRLAIWKTFSINSSYGRHFVSRIYSIYCADLGWLIKRRFLHIFWKMITTYILLIYPERDFILFLL